MPPPPPAAGAAGPSRGQHTRARDVHFNLPRQLPRQPLLLGFLLAGAEGAVELEDDVLARGGGEQMAGVCVRSDAWGQRQRVAGLEQAFPSQHQLPGVV